MSDLRQEYANIKIDENASRNVPTVKINDESQESKEYNIIFTVSAIDEIQDYFDEDINDLFNKILVRKGNRNYFKNLVKVLEILINEDILINKKDKLQEGELKHKVTNANCDQYLYTIMQSYTLSFLKPEEDENSPNLTSKPTE